MVRKLNYNKIQKTDNKTQHNTTNGNNSTNNSGWNDNGNSNGNGNGNDVFLFNNYIIQNSNKDSNSKDWTTKTKGNKDNDDSEKIELR